jgi:hypothetical protein
VPGAAGVAVLRVREGKGNMTDEERERFKAWIKHVKNVTTYVDKNPWVTADKKADLVLDLLVEFEKVFKEE